jgi:anti-sigma factor RsiW
MTCRDLDPLIYPYLDGELEGTERDRLDAHAAECPPCRSRLSREAAFQGALRRSAQVRGRAPAPEALRELLRSGIRREQRRVQMLSWARWGSVALVAAAASTSWLVLRPGHPEQLLEDATVRFQRRLPFEVTQASHADVEQWFDDKLSYRVPVPRLPGTTLVGARLYNVKEHDAAYITYVVAPSAAAPRDRRMGLFVLDDSAGEIPSIRSYPQVSVRAVRGFTVATWRAGGLVYELVSDLDEPELRQMLAQMNASPAVQTQVPETPMPVRVRPMLPIPPRSPAFELQPAVLQN